MRIRHIFLSVVALGVVLAASACSGTPETASNVASLSITDTKVGTGAVATAGKDVTVAFTGWVYDGRTANHRGRQFDSSSNRGQPLTFRIGSGAVIRGGEQGVEGMKVGGTRTLIIPAELAYGSRGDGSLVPPNAALVFDVELLDVK